MTNVTENEMYSRVQAVGMSLQRNQVVSLIIIVVISTASTLAVSIYLLTGPLKEVFRGSQGIQGEKGEQGIQGEQGLQGVQGIQGLQGLTGAPFSFTGRWRTLAEFSVQNSTVNYDEAKVVAVSSGLTMVYHASTGSAGLCIVQIYDGVFNSTVIDNKYLRYQWAHPAPYYGTDYFYGSGVYTVRVASYMTNYTFVRVSEMA